MLSEYFKTRRQIEIISEPVFQKYDNFINLLQKDAPKVLPLTGFHLKLQRIHGSTTGLVWFGFMANQPLLVINAESIYIHMNSSISNNSV